MNFIYRELDFNSSEAAMAYKWSKIMAEPSSLSPFNLLENWRRMEKVVGIKQLRASKHEVRLVISFTFLMEASLSWILILFITWNFDSARVNKLMFLQKNYPAVPQWVVVMYNTVFFRTCITHPDSRMDRFCADCYSSLCSNCLPAHARHKHVKVHDLS